MRRPNNVFIKEVGPRDGLQNEKEWVSTDDKVEWINMLSESGIKEIEFSSFVHPRWVPALKDAREVGKRITRNPDVTYSALVPNEKGLEHALEAGIDMASVFMSASETHNRKNINKSIAETYPVLKKVIDGAKQEEKRVTGYISTVFDCPFEGKINTDNVLRVCDRLFELGVDDLSLGDTIGTAVPSQVEELLEAILYRFPNKDIIMHFHDTRGMAIANIVTSMNYGINRFDSSVGGLGGCPYAPGAAGNVATNDLLYLLHGVGINTGIDEKKLEQAAFFIQAKLEKQLPSRALSYRDSQTKKRNEFVQANDTRMMESPPRKREIIYFFLKNQYDKLRSKE
ncbi:hydroxymethylglutaryl-CoA lyase [Pseudogracilibacillus sp. SO30301A]|uniref:hydroxymethylglutaryl-CoA lyase n=1 Tax=Pseudogracilibacillus sp. SO30301A TaxID=3098291 RepID=UPI00300E24AE